MTDEEKAEENYTKVYLNGDISLNTEEKYFAYTKGYCKGYKDGLTEGIKETESHLLENWCRNEDDYCPHLKQLEKENAELKEQANTMQTSFEMYKLDVITILTSMGIKDEFLERLEQFNKICNRPWSD